jgi:hypothetical protein
LRRKTALDKTIAKNIKSAPMIANAFFKSPWFLLKPFFCAELRQGTYAHFTMKTALPLLSLLESAVCFHEKNIFLPKLPHQCYNLIISFAVNGSYLILLHSL